MNKVLAGDDLMLGTTRPGGTFTINPTFGSALSQNGWLRFSRTPHSDAVFSGKIGLDERVFQGEPVGVGVQGSQLRVPATGLFNLDACILPEPGWTCYDHRSALLHHSAGLTFRKAVLWHQGTARIFRRLRETVSDRENLRWSFKSVGNAAGGITVEVDGTGSSIHRLPYLKTNCSGTFEVANNSFACARLVAWESDDAVKN